MNDSDRYGNTPSTTGIKMLSAVTTQVEQFNIHYSISITATTTQHNHNSDSGLIIIFKTTYPILKTCSITMICQINFNE